MPNIEYTPLNLPKALVEELKIWKRAYSNVYNKPVSYGEMIRGFLDSMDLIEPAIVDELENMVKLHPTIGDSLAKYKSRPGDDSEG